MDLIGSALHLGPTSVVDLIGSALHLGPTSWQGWQARMTCSIYLSMLGHHTFCRSLAVVRTIPWWPSWKSFILRFQRLSGITLPRFSSCSFRARPTTHTSPCKLLVPEQSFAISISQISQWPGWIRRTKQKRLISDPTMLLLVIVDTTAPPALYVVGQ